MTYYKKTYILLIVKKIHLKIHSTIGNKKYTFADVGVKDTDAVIKRYGYFTNQ